MHAGIDSTVVFARKVNISSTKNGKSFLRKWQALGPPFLPSISSLSLSLTLSLSISLSDSSISKSTQQFFFCAEKLILTRRPPPQPKLILRWDFLMPGTPRQLINLLPRREGGRSNSVDLVSFFAKEKKLPFSPCIIVTSSYPLVRAAFQCQIFWLGIRFAGPAFGLRK